MIPSGITESECLKVIESVVNILAPQVKLGYWDLEDIKQEGRYEALRALPRFNPTAGNPSKERDNIGDRLYNFLRQHVRFRYINLYRDKVERLEPPCSCPPDNSICFKFGTKDCCQKWQAWICRNESKKHLSQSAAPIPLEELRVASDIRTNELVKLVDIHIDISLRSDFIRIMNDVPIPKARRDKVISAAGEIIESGMR